MRSTNEKKTARARQLRRDSTMAEKRLWSALCNRQIEGQKFVRQMPIGPFFADFACRESKLVIELDGAQHVDSSTDASRTKYLKAHGYRVLRFWNSDILEALDGVVRLVANTLDQTAIHQDAPHPPIASRRAPPSPR